MNLRPEDEAYAAALITAGRYQTTDDVIAAAFTVLRHAEEELAEFYASCEQGSAEIAAGHGLDGEGVLADLRRQIQIAAEVKRRMIETFTP
jgi:hypothetical protein